MLVSTSSSFSFLGACVSTRVSKVDLEASPRLRNLVSRADAAGPLDPLEGLRRLEAPAKAVIWLAIWKKPGPEGNCICTSGWILPWVTSSCDGVPLVDEESVEEPGSGGEFMAVCSRMCTCDACHDRQFPIQPKPEWEWVNLFTLLKKKGSSSPYSYSSMTSDLGHVWSVICIISIPSLSLRQSTSSFHLLVFCVGAHLDFLIAHQMTPRPLTSDVPEDPETMIAGNAKNNTLRETLWKLILSWHHSHKHPVQ